MKHGRHFKIGFTNDVGRRRYDLKLLVPEHHLTIHAFESDDPRGIEACWHNRFEANAAKELAKDGISALLSGEVEADETFVGEKVSATKITRTGERKLARGPATGTTTVLGMVEPGDKQTRRKSCARAVAVPDHKRSSLMPYIRANALPGSMIYTDALRSSRQLGPEYAHAIITTRSTT
jgi:hypothetical protein